MVLVRRLIGDVLRRRRVDQGRTLREVSAAARVSLGYLSEVERGRKEASSELLAAICQALDLPMSEVLREVSEEMSRVEAAAVGALTQLRPPRRPAGRDMVAVGVSGIGDVQGGADPAGWTACWLSGDRLVAVLAVNRPRDLTQGRRVMLNDLQIDADRLADPAVSIKDATC